MNEVSLGDAKPVARLSTLEYTPPVEVKPSGDGDVEGQDGTPFDQLTAIIGTEKAEAVVALADADATSGTIAPILLDPIAEKEPRKRVHVLVREQFGKTLDTSTLDGGIVEVRRKGKQGGPRGSNARAGATAAQGERWHRAPQPSPFCRFVLFKENRDTLDAISYLAKSLFLNPKLFTYAGTKDKRAITTQFVTAKNVAAEKLATFNRREYRGMRVGDFEYVERDTQLGDLYGNRFTIALRRVTGASEVEMAAALKSVGERGFINYFGMQRFGSGAVATHRVGMAVLGGDWESVVRMLLEPRGRDDSNFKARKAWLAGDLPLALKLCRRNAIAERAMLEYLSKEKMRMDREGANASPINYSNAFGSVCKMSRVLLQCHL